MLGHTARSRVHFLAVAVVADGAHLLLTERAYPRRTTCTLTALPHLCSEEEEQRALAALLAQHKAEYARIQAAFKQAAVDQRTAALKSAAEERRELLAGGEAGLRQRRAQTEADAAALAEDVTGGLRRTRQVGAMGGWQGVLQRRSDGWAPGHGRSSCVLCC